VVPVEITLTRICLDAAPLFTWYMLDLSERKQTEGRIRRAENLRQAQKMEAVGQLADGIAHDFNNLLTAIELINKAGNRAAVLTRQLLAFSRRQVLELKVFDLNVLVTDLTKMLRRMIGEDINMVLNLTPNAQLVKADMGQIEQVLMNLAVNARDAMPQGGKLIIETRSVRLAEGDIQTNPEVRPGSYVMLAVSDTGHGMDEATKARVFEPFFTTKEVGKGTGLGLATVYGIIKQTGGHVTVYSEPGHGSTFKVYLPGTEEAVTPPAPAPTAVAPSGKETVLLVEDEELVRIVSRQVLHQAGYTVREAKHGREALQLSEEELDEVTLTVTDVVMPEMGGRELGEQLLKRKPGMKMLYVSGYTDKAVTSNGLLVQNMAFLEKPFTPPVPGLQGPRAAALLRPRPRRRRETS
jgi:nitrogen-specific signal transduction histidine kinase